MYNTAFFTDSVTSILQFGLANLRAEANTFSCLRTKRVSVCDFVILEYLICIFWLLSSFLDRWAAIYGKLDEWIEGGRDRGMD